ncbi:hypothetical protein BDW69DRAFT_159912 [Aspergillus filifer]
MSYPCFTDPRCPRLWDTKPPRRAKRQQALLAILSLAEERPGASRTTGSFERSSTVDTQPNCSPFSKEGQQPASGRRKETRNLLLMPRLC